MTERSTADAPPAEEAIAAAAMPTPRKLLCALYATIAIAGLIGTWSQAIPYFTGVLDIGPSLAHFLVDTKATPASRFIHVEDVFFFLAAAIFMVIEARKHSIRLVWAYIAGCPLIAISAAFPLFLIARELRRPTSDATHLKLVDIVPLAAVAFGCVGLVIFLVR
jgi:Terpene cyclase DEP1